MSRRTFTPAFGRVAKPDARDRNFPLRAALKPRAEVVAPPSRRWRLRRAAQLDQGDTPQCVAHTGKHWELSLPICTTSGMTAGELYAACKQLDGYPNEDGTDAHAMMKVFQRLGQVASYHWYTGDLEALKLWLLTESPAWFGAYWTPEMLEPDASGLLTVGEPDTSMGHEVLLIGYERRRDRFEILNSWGRSWGVNGRAWIRSADLQRLLDADGDCVVAVEQKAA